MSFQQIQNVNPGILNEVSEQQVTAWMAARLQQIRDDLKLPVHTMELSVWYRDEAKPPYFDAGFGAHAAGACVLPCESSDVLARRMREELLNNPQKNAAAKRAEAQRLMAEAATLEALATTPQS